MKPTWVTTWVSVDRDKHGHITKASHERARALASEWGVTAGLEFQETGRRLRVIAIWVWRDGRPVAKVEDVRTARRRQMFVEYIARTVAEGGGR